MPGKFSASLLAACVAGGLGVGTHAAAAPSVELQLATATGFPAASQRAWYDLFVGMGVDDLQIRGASPEETPSIEVVGPAGTERFVVVGLLTPRDELLLPGGKFRRTDKAKLSEWLRTLREEGPDRAAGAPAAPYGLTDDAWTSVQQEMARPVGFSTKGMTLADALEQFGRGLGIPLNGDPKIAPKLKAAPPIEVELSGLATGTALAFVLSQADLAVEPQAGGERKPELMIRPAAAASAPWPVGRVPEGATRPLAPNMFEPANVELQDVPLSRLLAAVAEKCSLLLLIDARSLAAADVALDETRVTEAPRRMTYAQLLRRSTQNAKLASELRVDEAGKGFLWITSAESAARARRGM